MGARLPNPFWELKGEQQTLLEADVGTKATEVEPPHGGERVRQEPHLEVVALPLVCIA